MVGVTLVVLLMVVPVWGGGLGTGVGVGAVASEHRHMAQLGAQGLNTFSWAQHLQNGTAGSARAHHLREGHLLCSLAGVS